MQETSFSELRSQAKRFFDIVEAGETVRVLRNGKPIAEIRPIQKNTPSWKQRKSRPITLDGVTISKLILDER